jgi:hypothetical protein
VVNRSSGFVSKGTGHASHLAGYPEIHQPSFSGTDPFQEVDVSKRALVGLRKGDSRKVLIAALLRKRTSVGVNWIADRLEMGHPGSVSRMLGKVSADSAFGKKLKDLEAMLASGD